LRKPWRATKGIRSHIFPKPKVRPAEVSASSYEHLGVDEVVVHEGVVVRGQDDAPHHDQQQRTGCRGDPHRDSEGESNADPEQTDHEQPVCPSRAGDVVVEALERPVGPELQEAFGRAAAVDPGCVAEPVDDVGLRVPAGGEPESEQLVEERPQEHPAEREPGRSQDIAVGLVSRRLLVDRLGEECVVGA
jgi:hypothetical protein